MAVKLPDTLVPMADFPSAFAKDVQFTDGENLQDKLDKGKLGSSSSGTGLTEEQANNIEKIPSIEGIVTSNSQAIANKADKDHEHTEYLTEIPDEYVTDTELSTELDKKVNKEIGKGLSTNDLTDELVIKINSSATEAFVTNAIANAQLDGGDVDLSGYATVDALNLKADLTHTHDQYLTEVPDEYITETELTAKGYLTEHQDISNLQSKTDNSLTTTDKTVTGAINELNNKQQLTEITLTSIEDLSNIEVGEYDAIIASSYELIKSGIYHVVKTSDTDIVLTSVDGNILSFNNPPWYPTWRQDLDKCFPQVFKYTLTDLSVLDSFGRGYFDVYIESSLSDGLVDSGIYNVYKPGGDSITFTSMSGVSYKYNKTGGEWTLETKGNFATETFVANKIAEASLSGGGVDLSGYATKDDVPTKTSELTNDSGFITSDDLPTVPTKVSDLENDSNFVTNSKMLEAISNAQLGNGEGSDMANLILDTEVRIDKTYSSSKIYSDIQQCLEDSKTYTLEELGKKIGASYEVVASTDDMVSQDRLYLLKSGNNYDIYIVDVDNVPVVIGDTSIDLSGYVTKTEIESELGTERLGTTSQTVKGAINEVNSVVTTEIAKVDASLDELENITSLSDFDKAIPEKGKNKIYYVNKTLGTYTCAQWRVESTYYDVSGLKQYRGVQKATSINGVDNIMLMRGYYLDDNNVMRWSDWQKVCTTSVVDVGVTTITPANSNITGNIEYTVKNGICYVSLFNVKSTTTSNGLSISTTMPKPAINSSSAIVKQMGGGNIGFIYINKNTTQLTANINVADITGSCSFSYPVAEQIK